MKLGLDPKWREATCEWARANGLTPEKIHEDIQLVNGETIKYKELVGYAEGMPVWEDRTVPMAVPFHAPADTTS